MHGLIPWQSTDLTAPLLAGGAAARQEARQAHREGAQGCTVRSSLSGLPVTSHVLFESCLRLHVTQCASAQGLCLAICMDNACTCACMQDASGAGPAA